MVWVRTTDGGSGVGPCTGVSAGGTRSKKKRRRRRKRSRASTAPVRKILVASRDF